MLCDDNNSGAAYDVEFQFFTFPHHFRVLRARTWQISVNESSQYEDRYSNVKKKKRRLGGFIL